MKTASASTLPTPDPADTPALPGLDAQTVATLRQTHGYNELPQPHSSLIKAYLHNFWGPLAWLLELTIAITLATGRTVEAGVMVMMLLINSGINIYQRRSADAALATLSHHLQVVVRVLRDSEWTSRPARELVPGDIVRLRTGDVVPADVVLGDGGLSVDLSALTGESVPRDVAPGEAAFSGGTVRRGEATAAVTATGNHTAYARTSQLLEVAHPPTHMERVIFAIIKCFFVVNLVLAIAVVTFGWINHIAAIEVTNFIIVLLITSVPVAFPTMFAVAQSYGALLLTRHRSHSVLVRRLAAVQEAAVMDVLCSDKTGTLTQNSLSLHEVVHYGRHSEDDVLALAVAASDEADEDVIDTAVLRLAAERGVAALPRQSFVPFDIKTKRTEAHLKYHGRATVVRKGLPELLLTAGVKLHTTALADVERLSALGLRVVAVVAGSEVGGYACVGLLGLADPIREEAPALIIALGRQGIRTVMITGDGRRTAAAVARQLGIEGTVITGDELRANPAIAATGLVFAETFPEDKLTIIRALQAAGHTVGMTGDGVNDAPALRQAEVGIAVMDATDVAKQSASFILTTPGLAGIANIVDISRSVYARLRTWALNKITKSIEVGVLSAVVFFATGSYILAPIFAVLLLLANDFVVISIATDSTDPMPRPAHWRVAQLMQAGAVIALVPLAGAALIYLAARHWGYSLPVIRTGMYMTLVYLGAATLLGLRAWPHAWNRRPSDTLLIALTGSALFTLAVAVSGIIVAPVPLGLIGLIVAVSVVSWVMVDLVKGSQLVRGRLE